MSSEISHALSLQQLDELWKYDFHLCSTLTDLPLRTCSARPDDSLNDLFPPMTDEEFRLLKQDILKMWVRATYFFKFKAVAGKGWGVFCPPEEDDSYPNQRLLSPTKPVVFGWLAKAPQKDQCPTAHRYLRSPLGNNLYLGGPISFVNQSDVGRLAVNIPTCTKTAARHIVRVTSQRKLLPGLELLWTYVAGGICTRKLDLHRVSEWFLPECCSEGKDTPAPVEVPRPREASPTTSESPAKKRCIGGIRPLTKCRELPRFCLCTFCGINVDEHSNYSPNLKRHLSLHHAVDIVKDIGKDPLDQEDSISSAEFVLHIDKLNNVLDELHKRSFNCQPACSFLQNFGEEVQLRNDMNIDEEKERIFKLFVTDSLVAFKRYQVLYLKGVSVPTKYDDLLPCEDTNYEKVIWSDKKPSNNYFSINKLKLTSEEKEDHKYQVMCSLKYILAAYK